jgi:hypothetical protein
MRIAEVIGTVTLSRVHPALESMRFMIGVPFSLTALRQDAAPDGEDLVILDSYRPARAIASDSAKAARQRFHSFRNANRWTLIAHASLII